MPRCDYGEGLVMEWSEFEYQKIDAIRNRPRVKDLRRPKVLPPILFAAKHRKMKDAILQLYYAGLGRDEIIRTGFSHRCVDWVLWEDKECL